MMASLRWRAPAGMTVSSIRRLAIASIYVGAAACGGGGGGGSTPPPVTFSLSTDTVSFATAAPDYGTPAPNTVTATVTGPASGTLYIIVSLGNPSLVTVSNFAVTSNTSGQATITPVDASTLSAGTYTEALTVTACLNDSTCHTGQLQGSPQTITVNYAVAGVASNPSSLSYSVGNAPTAANSSQTLSVTGTPVQTWTASTNAPWLTLSPTTGSTSAAQTVTAALDQTQISTLDGGTYTGTVTLTPTTGLPLTLPVSLTIARTQVNFVAPQVIPANTAVNVIIRGENFSSIMPTGVNFNSTAASSFTVVSTTEIHATTAAMPAGNYVVHIANAQGVDRTNAQLTVTSAIPYTAGVLAYSPPLGFPNGLIYDAARQALLVSNWSPPLGNASGVIDRYAYSSANSSWGAPTSVAIPGPNVISLSLSGQQLYVAYLPTASTAFTLAQLDPMTLATIGSVQDPTMQLQGSSIAVANDGRAFIEAVSSTTSLVGYYQYAPLSNALTPVGYDPILGGYEGFVASGNGSVLLAEAGGVTFEYSSAMDQLIRTAVQYPYAPIQINIDGTRVVDDDFNVYDGSGNLLGSLPATTQNCLLGPFSSYAYTYDSNGTVRVFDLSQPAVGGFFADQRAAITPVQSPDSIFTRAAMAITPDEGTLFLAGDAQIVVVPLH